MRTLEDAVEDAVDAGASDYEEEDDPAPVLPAPLAPRLGLSADAGSRGDFETYNRAVKTPSRTCLWRQSPCLSRWRQRRRL